MKRSFFQYLNEKRKKDYSYRTYEINGHKMEDIATSDVASEFLIFLSII